MAVGKEMGRLFGQYQRGRQTVRRPSTSEPVEIDLAESDLAFEARLSTASPVLREVFRLRFGRATLVDDCPASS